MSWRALSSAAACAGTLHMRNTSIEQATLDAATTRGVALTLHKVRKSYGPRLVIDDVDLALAPGEFVAIVGRSGCGKSTLLRAIAGLESLDGGTIVGTSQLRMMFQEARLLPWKTVAENVRLGLQGDVTAALTAVGLGDRADDWPAALSGGQKQRVALARALAHQPPLLLLDEPLGALDALTRIEMQRLIESLWLARGFTAVLVTHDVQEAISLADRVLVIENGRIAVDVRVDLPRPRQRDAAFAALESALLDRLLSRAR